MKDSFGKALPACLGSSFAVTLIQFFRGPDTWGLGDFLLNFVFTLIITVIVVTLCFWAHASIAKKKQK